LARILQRRKPKEAMIGFNVHSTLASNRTTNSGATTFDDDVAYGTDNDGLTLNLDPTQEAP
jgi:hypothetical protein